MNEERYDIAIVGSGIVGAALAAILARHGKRVIVFEAKEHPRFAIGESMILETSEVLRAMAEFYDVPELAYYSSEHYMPLVGYSHGVKRHFSFLHHVSGRQQEIEHAFQAIIPREPHGHELHIYRQDSDYFLASTAIAYGATVMQNTPVSGVEISSGGVEVATANGTYIADYIVDSGGYRSILAEQHELRDYQLQTHSRSLFTHMLNVPDFHKVSSPRERYGFPFSVAEGTLHHIFEGGWMWVIPFNNYDQATNPLCSVGLMLDPRVHPEDRTLSAKEEFCRFVSRFPDMASQFRGARAVRSWTRTGRIQYASKQVVGERFALLGHAAGFIDPLFSKGMYVSLNNAFHLAHLLLEAPSGYPSAHFTGFEKRTKAFVRAHDRLVNNSYKAFSNYRLWEVYIVLWLLGAYTELVKLMSSRTLAADRDDYCRMTQGLRLVGGGFEAFDALEERINEIMDAVNPSDESEVDTAVRQMRACLEAIDWLPAAFREVLAGKRHLPKNKLNLALLKSDTGFLGNGSYRRHFFGETSRTELIRILINEKIRYSSQAVRRGKKR